MILKWIDPRARLYADALDEIFFQSSATKSFASLKAREAFRERWLGRYLHLFPDWAYLAIGGNAAADGNIAAGGNLGPGGHGDLLGYLVGSVCDPAHSPIFSDIGYFQAFAALTAQFPAQLHVNVSASARSQGIGGKLVGAFVEDARLHGCEGAHVVTGRGMRNSGFYERLGFEEAGGIEWRGQPLVFLGRCLGPGA